jgi:hypothetical protein
MTKLSLLALAIATACTTSQSKDIATEGMYSSNTITADGSGATSVTTVLRVGGALSNDFVELSPGDTLTASAGALSTTMTPGTFLDADAYQATLAVNTGGTVVTIAYTRADPQISASNTAATLPEELAITSQTSGTDSYSRAGSPIAITWTGSGQTDPLSYEVVGTCIATASGSISPDNGSFTIPAGTIQALSGSTTQSCSIQIQLLRSRQGTLDAAFGNGDVTASQVRAADALSTP